MGLAGRATKWNECMKIVSLILNSCHGCVPVCPQSRGEVEKKKRFINDTVRNDFHRSFLKRYMR
jgi:hypothetical protein